MIKILLFGLRSVRSDGFDMSKNLPPLSDGDQHAGRFIRLCFSYHFTEHHKWRLYFVLGHYFSIILALRGKKIRLCIKFSLCLENISLCVFAQAV